MFFDYLIPKPLHSVREQLLTEYLLDNPVKPFMVTKIRNSIGCVLYNLTYNIQNHNNQTDICLSAKYFTNGAIYNGVKIKRKISYNYFRSVVEWMAGNGYVLIEYGGVTEWWDGKPKEVTKTMLTATEDLMSLILPVSSVETIKPKSVLEVRSKDRKPLQFNPTQLQKDFIHLTESANAVLDENRVVLDGKAYPLRLKKIFNLNMNHGGRYYPVSESAGVVTKKKNRNRLIIGGESVVECDFSALHPRILATEAGVVLPDDFDPYDIPQGRELGKLACLIVINCGVGQKAIQAATYHSDYSYPVCAKAIEELVERNPYLLKCKDKMDGLRLQNVDSQIMDGVIAGLVKENKGFVPVHDSTVVQESMCGTLVDLMTESYKKVLKTTNNCVIRISRG